MDHADALELIELAAVEPDGLERLMAGDTPGSAAVAGHLAGCPACVAELARIRRTAVTARDVIADLPDPELRARTLAFVREVGRDRSGAGVETASVGAPVLSVVPEAGAVPRSSAAPEPPAWPVPVASRTRSRRRWVVAAGLAAVFLVAVGLGFAAGRLNAPPSDAAGREIAVLQETTETMLRLGSQPDTRTVELVPTAAGGGSAGTLMFSPASGELVMVASGLPALTPGQEYGCWVEVNGQRTRIGKMYPGGDLQSWAGPVSGLADLPPHAVFGVSLVPAPGAAGEPVLTGGL